MKYEAPQHATIQHVTTSLVFAPLQQRTKDRVTSKQPMKHKSNINRKPTHRKTPIPK